MPDNRVLVKLRPSQGLAAAASRVNLRPVRISGPSASEPFSITGEPQWYVADLPDGAALPWDLAHARIADQLGVADSDVLFAEPDLVNDVFVDDGDTAAATGGGAAATTNCTANPQDPRNGQAVGPHDRWHLDDEFTQLRSARGQVKFTDPGRTRIAHFDTGYYQQQVTKPLQLNHALERDFADDGTHPDVAMDPDNKVFLLDNSGHGTGTISILAGADYPGSNESMGGAPDAEVVPLRLSDRVVLLRTSAFASALDYAVDNGCDVGTMSMGGLPSKAWRESIDRAYLAGFCLVAAAGNNIQGAPTRHLVYPARYGRVIAACGVMADDRPYDRLGGTALQGNYGPDHVMGSSVSAFTPNISWARYGCETAVRQSGGGTSAATPQVAATVALWYEKYKSRLPRDWRRVEAVRNAIFTSARIDGLDKKKLGHGIIRALDALAIAPRLDLAQTKADNDSFSFLRVITGLGIVDAPPREQMFNLEIVQRWLLNADLQKVVPNPEAQASLDPKALAKVMEILIEDEKTSITLRKHLVDRFSIITNGKPPKVDVPATIMAPVLPAAEPVRAVRPPTSRTLRVYASDPSLATRLDTIGINEAMLDVRWESLEPGPVGEYLAVEDTDASGRTYAPVDLDAPELLAQDGWAPSEGNAQFHQQMTYAVAMTTIAHFERALGRPVLWRSKSATTRARGRKASSDAGFVQRLTIQPHALHEANAYYSPNDIALKFGYFEATTDTPGALVPGSRVYACCSHDIIAHETTHAILDGMHRRFSEATNPDTLAFHEGFADLVALLQHFTMRDLLRNEIARTRGDLATESMLGSLAVQFGNAIGNRGALRDAIGHMENGTWQRSMPDPRELKSRVTPHARGAILVAAVFDAYLAIYRTRTADLLRISTGGTGVLPNGAIHPDLVNRLADEASKVAGHVLTMCIRALDYVPPVDVTFFDVLRGIITADFEFVPDDPFHYRVAFVEAFRARGIYSLDIESDMNDLRTVSVDTVRWREMDPLAPTAGVARKYLDIVKALREYADQSLYCDTREGLFTLTTARRRTLMKELAAAFKAEPKIAADLGLDPALGAFEVEELRRASRVTIDGTYVPQLIVALTQSRDVPATAGRQAFTMRGGSTLVVDLAAQRVKYRIFKNINSQMREERAGSFAADVAGDPLRALLFGADHAEPFAVLHSLTVTGE